MYLLRQSEHLFILCILCNTSQVRNCRLLHGIKSMSVLCNTKQRAQNAVERKTVLSNFVNPIIKSTCIHY